MKTHPDRDAYRFTKIPGDTPAAPGSQYTRRDWEAAASIPMEAMQSSAHDMMIQMMAATENAIADQLGDLVKEGILVWVETQPVITHDVATNKIRISKLGKLQLRDVEVFERLKKERDDWREKYEKLQAKVDACFKE